ncbi:sugar phosphate isomerase/epimerase family protein [Candidatus Viridilinea mediisalina]|uniref:Xylose isomerase-like TIM barrel domain-containing protein n=1 Tax=Candidatus Viridilinea mediisalina TaxID=2024553 RepID=A0A2A6RNK8_9CHLR|nr:TIM barrel protein [Candidatus Viridilinea mediisalina]PDW04449.1 hypothetical protein CJ255_03445 [Candidatus Viridilinea mediisalina]
MQLAFSITLGPDDHPGPLANQVAELGYNALHVHFAAGYDPALARRLASASAESGLPIVAVSGYANPLRPADAPMGMNFDQLADLIEWLPQLNTRRIICWSGSYAPGIFEAHPENQSLAARAQLREQIEDLLPLLDEAEAILLLAPHHRHVLHNPTAIAEFCAELNSPYLRILLDLPNLLPPAHWLKHSATLRQTVAQLAPYVGLLQCQDMCLRDGHADLCAPGQGLLNYPQLMRAVRAAELIVPFVVGQTELSQAAAVRRLILDHWRT